MSTLLHAPALAPALPGFEAPLDRFCADVDLKRPRPLGYGLWLAIFPPPAVAQRIARRAAGLCREHGFSGSVQPAARLHITLLAITGGPEAPPQRVVDAVNDAAALIPCGPVRIVFDRVLTFATSRVFVLRCTADSDAGIGRLRQMLATTLRRRALRPSPRPSATPHMTMMYGTRRTLPEQAIEPIAWTADRFALVLSHVGATHHQWIRQWPLR